MLIDHNHPVCFGHTNCKDTLEAFMKDVEEKGDDYFIGSVVGTHAGPGGVAIAYFEKTK